ncbi:TetR/AcrR family transcriptional regulator [Oceanobacillus sp. Castelsardo]|uniref:TetR/AcrR family transcriptional regulator n=1 Tax=Oceanobacillus sp. Castelsardo TaxID=1851204 RepID=UPI000AA5C19F|nr:TetR/AcrR family transcriptional regulator [Oceanobacillus sp. Castelsardo]
MDQLNNLTKRQRQAMETRERLLTSGKCLFIRNGFQKTTMTQINKQARTGYGTAYVYFKNKDELFIHLIDHVMEKMYEVANLPFSPETREEAYSLIHNQVEKFLIAAVEEKQIMAVIEEAIGISSTVREKWNIIRNRFVAGITRDITTVQQKGLAKREMDASLIAKGWFYMNEQLMWDLVTNRINDSVENIANALTKLYTGGLYMN